MPWGPLHAERHLSLRSNWLRAAVLGANDGILSTASLVLGVAASGASRSAIVTAGIAGLMAGAGSMAAGEYVSVSSQRDTEDADLRLERHELATDPEGELLELTGIYEGRGLRPELAAEVAHGLTEHKRARSTRARRARPAGGSPRPAVAGGRRLGPLLCGRRAPVPTRNRRLRLIEPDRRLHHRDPVGADRAWRPGRQTRRRARSACGRSRRPLGGDRDGRDRRRRRPGRNRGVATS